MKHQLCCIGHITHDKIITPRRTAHQPGGTSYYFSHAIRRLPEIDYMLVTALGAEDMHVVDELRREGIQVKVMPSRQSVYFENIYGENQDNRTQHVLAKADPFTVEYLQDVEAQIFHLGSLLADDFSLEVVKYLSGKGRISIDAQGYLREVQGEDVFPVDWERKEEFLRHVYFLKANEPETLALTGTNDPMVAAVPPCLFPESERTGDAGLDGHERPDGRRRSASRVGRQGGVAHARQQWFCDL